MLVDNWDYRISDIARACSIFISESMYPIEYSSENTLSTLWAMYNDPDTELLVDYTGDKFNGFAIVQRTNEFHKQFFGYLGKFYILPERRLSRGAYRLIGEATRWFDQQECVVSFATATAGIGRDDSFVKLLTRFGYAINETGILTRKQHE